MAKKITIDNGHFNSDSGAVNNELNLREVDINNDVTNACIAELRRHGIEAQETSGTLKQRTDACNRFNPICCISIHTNSASVMADGFGSYIYRKGGESEKLAKIINEQIINIDKINNAHGDPVKVSNLHMVRETNCPAVLVEMAFINNSNDISCIDEKHERAAMGISLAKAILKYIGVTHRPSENIPTPPPATNKQVYRVRSSWDNALSQKGAFSDLNNAKKCADENKMNVYNENGGCIYESVKVDKGAFWNSCNAHAKVNLNPRSEASSNSLDLGNIYANEKIKIRPVVSDNNTFLPIQFYRSNDNSIIDAWIECNVSKFDIHFKNKVVNVNSKLLARYSPTSNSSSFGQVYNNESVLILKEENGYKLCAYRTTGGYAKIGWFTGSYIK